MSPSLFVCTQYAVVILLSYSLDKQGEKKEDFFFTSGPDKNGMLPPVFTSNVYRLPLGLPEREKKHHFFSFERRREMPILNSFLLILVPVLAAENLYQSYIQLGGSSNSFHPANLIELLETRFVSSLLQCGYGKRECFL